MIEIKIIKTNIDKSIDNLKTLLYDATNLNTKRTRAFIIRDERPFVIGGEKLAVGEAMKQVMEGRYDLCVFLKNNYDSVKDEVDPDGDLIFIPFTSIKTWVIFGQGQEELIKAIDGAMQTLEEDGTLEEISMKYYGENVYRY